MVQFHALSLLYEIKQHDRLAISKMVAQLTRGAISSPMATCLLIRYITAILKGSDVDMLASATGRAAYQFLELSLRHRSEAVIYEAAKAIVSLPGVEERDLGGTAHRPLVHVEGEAVSEIQRRLVPGLQGI